MVTMAQATTKAPQAKGPNNPVPASNPPAPAATTQIPVPQTQADVDVLLDRRSELSTQLNSASGRRNDLSRQLRNAQPGPDRAGIEARISNLDGRIISIESEMADVGRALSAAPSGLRQTNSTTTTTPPFRYGQPSAAQLTGMTIVGMFTIGLPLSIAFARLIFRRGNRPPPPQIPKDVSDRLERMEQGIEAVAVEVERIGEGQRFVTQLMSDRAQRAALPEGIPRT